MAGIQIHQQLKDHRKVLAAADELDIEPAHCLGLLTRSGSGPVNAPDGSLAGISDRMIARAAQWDKDPEEFVAALTSASLLDVTEGRRSGDPRLERVHRKADRTTRK